MCLYIINIINIFDETHRVCLVTSRIKIDVLAVCAKCCVTCFHVHACLLWLYSAFGDCKVCLFACSIYACIVKMNYEEEQKRLQQLWQVNKRKFYSYTCYKIYYCSTLCPTKMTILVCLINHLMNTFQAAMKNLTRL